jgi:WD40 repeat protein
VCTLTGHSSIVTSVAYSPDGKHIVSGSCDNTVKVWDSQTGKEVSVLVCHRPIVCCCVDCADLRVWSMSRSAR